MGEKKSECSCHDSNTEGKYASLWKKIGLDPVKHKALMEACACHDSENFVMMQKNRPKKMDWFDFMCSDIHGFRPDELDKLRQAGQKVVGTFCVYAPEELIYAAGATQVSLCGGLEAVAIPDAELVLPRNLCPMVKSSYGFKSSRTCPYNQSCDLVIGETTCDGKKKMFELFKELAPLHVIEIPHKSDTVQSKELWRKEYEEFKIKLETLTGNKITAESLKEAIELVNNKRKALQRLSNLRKNIPVPITGLDFLVAIQVSFFDDVKRATEKINVLCDELDERVKNGIGVAAKDAPRLVLSGCPMAMPNWKVHGLAELAGASIVVEETCTGTRYFDGLVEPKGNTLDDMMDALVNAYSSIHCACFTPNDARVEDITKLAKDFKADGVLYYVLQFCHGYNIEGVKVEKALKAANLPMLRIETDYGELDAGQIRTRIEAFLEMIRGKTNKMAPTISN